MDISPFILSIACDNCFLSLFSIFYWVHIESWALQVWLYSLISSQYFLWMVRLSLEWSCHQSSIYTLSFQSISLFFLLICCTKSWITTEIGWCKSLICLTLGQMLLIFHLLWHNGAVASAHRLLAMLDPLPVPASESFTLPNGALNLSKTFCISLRDHSILFFTFC